MKVVTMKRSVTMLVRTSRLSTAAGSNPAYKPKRICSRGRFYACWEIHYSDVIVQKPLRDICGVCFKFNKFYCQELHKKKKETLQQQQERLHNVVIFGDNDNNKFDGLHSFCLPCNPDKESGDNVDNKGNDQIDDKNHDNMEEADKKIS